jgi:hypothetical protein
MNSFKTTAVLAGIAVFLFFFVLCISGPCGSVQFAAIVTLGLIMAALAVACFRHVIVLGRERVQYTALGVISTLALVAVIWAGKSYLSYDAKRYTSSASATTNRVAESPQPLDKEI